MNVPDEAVEAARNTAALRTFGRYWDELNPRLREDIDILIRAILAAAAPFLADGTGGGWQDISTAPRDGTVIRIKGEEGPYSVTAWEGKAVWGTPVNWHRYSSTWLEPDKSRAVLRLAGYSPTHWAPLDPSPSLMAED